MSIDNHLTASLGFRRPAYMAVERERRWLCHGVPEGVELVTDRITDLYVTGARLRLSEARPLSGGSAILRLSKKADVDSNTRLITTIYLSEEEFGLLSNVLPGKRIHKLRHRLPPIDGVAMSVDEFQGELAGLVMVEAEFDSAEALARFSAPYFAGPEVTGNVRFTGGSLVSCGLPQNLPELLAG